MANGAKSAPSPPSHANPHGQNVVCPHEIPQRVRAEHEGSTQTAATAALSSLRPREVNCTGVSGRVGREYSYAAFLQFATPRRQTVRSDIAVVIAHTAESVFAPSISTTCVEHVLRKTAAAADK